MQIWFIKADETVNYLCLVNFIFILFPGQSLLLGGHIYCRRVTVELSRLVSMISVVRFESLTLKLLLLRKLN